MPKFDLLPETIAEWEAAKPTVRIKCPSCGRPTRLARFRTDEGLGYMGGCENESCQADLEFWTHKNLA